MKPKFAFALVLILLVIDQLSKYYVKTHFYMGEEIIPFESAKWFRLHFVENEGMAYGWKLGGSWGKIALTVFRMIAVAFGTYYLLSIIRKNYHRGYIFCVVFIYAGALGNLIDSMFYGMVFEFSDVYAQNLARPFWVEGFQGGYEGFLHGRVVDMLYFPIIQDGRFPDWLPVWGGESFEFFRPVFNVADAAITGGVLALLVFQNRFFPSETQSQEASTD